MNVDKLKELRNSRTLSQRTFAAHLGVSQATIASWESGRTEPDNTMLKKIAKYFNVSIDYLLDNENEDNQRTADFNEDEMNLVLAYRELSDTDKAFTKEMINRFAPKVPKSSYYPNIGRVSLAR